ncbi:hypothetical protein GWI33_012700 [Rhynchophorus ferrugineus]|uniref:Uncharacterized protein n=1 Tax=Rhynchophorus ferrugineus TaxID=354439 RepID=A0A834I7V2_RHYFE|nr:hypothetical protein GWI33_012700 [Rhynchophorus ferrugineus]
MPIKPSSSEKQTMKNGGVVSDKLDKHVRQKCSVSPSKVTNGQYVRLLRGASILHLKWNGTTDTNPTCSELSRGICEHFYVDGAAVELN